MYWRLKENQGNMVDWIVLRNQGNEIVYKSFCIQYDWNEVNISEWSMHDWNELKSCDWK